MEVNTRQSPEHNTLIEHIKIKKHDLCVKFCIRQSLQQYKIFSSPKTVTIYPLLHFFDWRALRPHCRRWSNVRGVGRMCQEQTNKLLLFAVVVVEFAVKLCCADAVD